MSVQGDTEWLEVAIHAPPTQADDLAPLLADRVAAAAAGFELRGMDIVFWVPVPDGEQVLAQTRQAVGELAAAGWNVDPVRVVIRPAMAEAEWRDAWKRHFHVTRLTRQIVVVPSWEQYSPAAEDRVIHLDPGHAFGTGLHATTRLVLETTQSLRDDGLVIDRFLDVGTGSGILAIAALHLWPTARGLAIDTDELAVSAAHENAERNGVGEHLDCATTLVGEVSDDYPLVLANIEAAVLHQLCEQLAPRVAAGGRLILSGILHHQAEAVIGSFLATGLEHVRTRPDEETDWTCVVMRRP